jgi:diguanylate cyclase (GGDEF)-like protein/PAS domain S-box-containing protein
MPVSSSGLLRGNSRWAAWTVLACGAAVAVAAWYYVQSAVQRDARVRFQTASNAIAVSMRARMRSYADLLYGLRGLFQAEPAVSRSAFEHYVSSLDLALQFPNVRSISYARRLSGEEKPEFETRLRHDPELIRRGYADVTIRPPGERSQYLVVTYTEPLHPNRAAIGFDLAAGAERIDQIERARDTGMPTASGKLTLALDPSKELIGAVLRLALYRKDAFTPDVERRRAAFVGLLNVTFVVEELVQDILSAEEFQTFIMSIRDAGYADLVSDPRAQAPSAQELYSNAGLRPNYGAAVFTDSIDLDVGQRRWTLTLNAPRDQFYRPIDPVLPWAASTAVLLVALLLGGLIRSLGSSERRARDLAERITADLRDSEARLIEAQRRTQELIEVLPNPIFYKGTDGRYLGVNKAWEVYFGTKRDAFIGRTVHDLYRDKPETAALLHAKDQELWDRPGSQEYETVITTPDGKVRNTIYYKATFSNTEGKVAGLIGTIVDITERKNAEKRQMMEHAVTRVLADAASLAEASPRIIRIICDIMSWDCGARWQLDKEAKVLRCAEIWSGDDPAVVEFMAEHAKWPVSLDGESSGGLLRPICNSGRPLWVADMSLDGSFSRAPFPETGGMRGAFGFPLLLGSQIFGAMEFFQREAREPDDALLRIVDSLGNQIGQFIVRKQAEEQVRHLAHFDELTQLSNRGMFIQLVAQGIARARRNDKPLAVLYIDLDRFKNVNDSLGHEAGDVVLKEVAKRLRECLRDSDAVGRLGGDEFAVLLEGLPPPSQGAEVAQKIVAAMARPFVVEGREIQLGASIGISTYPGDSDDAQGLLKRADMAMYRAKEHGRGNYQFSAG